MKNKILTCLIFLVFVLNAESCMALWDMDISAPDSASVGEEITIIITSDGNPIEDADVYVNVVDYIGKTDINGEITHSFSIIGVYSIYAVKGLQTSETITVTVEQPVLSIFSDPYLPELGEEVTFTVKANLLEPVKGAAVYIDDVYIDSTDSNGEITHTFDESGIHYIIASKSGYIDAEAISCDIPEVDILNNVQIKGAIFPIPNLLENEILNYEGLPFQLPYISLVATENGLYVIFSNEKIEGGLANVEGLNLLSITWEGLEIGIVQATTVNIDKVGISTTIAQIESNPEQYAYELVRLDGTVRQCPFILDVTSFNMPITIGRIGKNPSYDMDFSNLIDKTYNFNQNFDSDVFNNLINIGSNSIAFFDFDKSALWCDSESTIDAIIMYPKLVRDFTNVISENQIGDVVIPTDESIILYLISSELDGEDTTIEEINSNFASYSNKVVSFEGSYLGVGASIKKIISASSAQIGNVLPVDLSLHGDYIWTSPPPTSLDGFKDKSLFVFGASSISQSSVISAEEGSLSIYRFTGKVISASDIDDSLEGAALIVYSRDKVRDLSIEEITDNIRNYVEGEITNMKYILQKQSPEKTEVSSVLTVDNSTVSVNKNDIENIDLNVKTELKGVSITTVKLDDKPAGIEVDVDGEVYGYLEISLNNVSDEDIEGGTIEFKVETSWLTNSNIDKNKVKLMKYVDGSWIELSTEFYKEASGYVYYKAETPGFSVFAITGEKTSSGDGGENVNNETPGFEFVFVIVVLLAVAYYLRKQK